MSATSTGLDLLEDGDDFVLVVTDASGKTTRTKLTSTQLLTLSQSAPAFREKILSGRHPSPATGIQAVLATPVVQVGLNTDALDEDILLTMIAANGGQLVYAVPAHIAQLLADNLPKWIAKLRKAKTVVILASASVARKVFARTESHLVSYGPGWHRGPFLFYSRNCETCAILN